MARKFLTPIDMTGLEVLNDKVQNVSSLPTLTSGDAGRKVYLTTTGRFYCWTGSAWDLTATSADLLNGAVDSGAHAGAYYQDRGNATGTQTSATISDLATTVHAYRLDQFAAPTTTLSAGSQRITAVATPTGSTDAAPKGYVDSAVSTLASGLVLKGSVRVATATNTTLTAPGATIDGVSMAANDVVMLMGQTTASQNGPWVWHTASTALTRPVDGSWTAGGTATLGSFWDVREGTSADLFALLVTATPVTIDTTSTSFVLRGNSTSAVTAGNGLTGTSTLSVLPASGGGLAVSGSGVAVDATVARKFTGIIPVSTAGSFSVSGAVVTINHALSNFAPKIEVRYYTSPGSGNVQGAELEVENVASDQNNIVVTLPAVPGSNQYYVSIIA